MGPGFWFLEEFGEGHHINICCLVTIAKLLYRVFRRKAKLSESFVAGINLTSFIGPG